MSAPIPDNLTDVRAALRIDARKLEAWLGAHVRGFAGPLAIRQFAGGQSNPTYFLETPGACYVLRRKPPGVLLPSAHAVDREYRVMTALGEQGFPVPEMLGFCEDTDVAGTIFYVMRFVPGRVFRHCTIPELSREERGAVYDSANETLARLHSLDPAAIGLSDYGKPGNYFGRQIARWTKQYEASRTDDIPEMDKVMAWLPGAVTADEEARLVHGDYSFHNLLYHPTEPRVAAVLDWELSTLGHPFADLFYHGMEWYRPAEEGDTRGTLEGVDTEALGIPTLEAYVARYCARTGRKPPENLAFYRAFNLFRVAAIVQGVFARAKAGNAASADALAQGARIRPLARAAWREAQAAGAT